MDSLDTAVGSSSAACASTLPGCAGRRSIRVMDRSGRSHDDTFESLQPTSHERRSGETWDALYRRGAAPWDIGSPQPAVKRLAAQDRFVGNVLDAGCGTGENSLHIASLGVPVLGTDVAETAIAIAREKADVRGVDAEFLRADALQLKGLGRTFRTVFDCGLFHTLDEGERARYVASLASVTEPGARLYVLCFSDEGPELGPHPVSQEELKASFAPGSGWEIVSIESDWIQARFGDAGIPAWLATIIRL